MNHSLLQEDMAPSTRNQYNRLGEEKSPYLLQHKDNPVNWFAWGDEAIATARKENKLIFLSIGYSTCYWCHAMEEDSFERPEVADILNRHFISIKVDREERPDLDKVYMEAVVRMTGRGGWPMTVFLTPDLKPFFGGTFFWRTQFLSILENLQQIWLDQPEKIFEAAQILYKDLEAHEKIAKESMPTENTLKKAFHQIEQSFDNQYGGFGRAPKFPQTLLLELLLRIHRRTGSQKALKMVTQTLDNMASGGIYDHLGGGFHRYSTDTEWRVPHFEKMLSDNALLAIIYLEAYQVTGHKRYARIVKGILDYILQEMTSPDGAFYSAEDAGQVGKEGEFYLWKEDELREALSEQVWQYFSDNFAITAQGNFENGENILYLKDKENLYDEESPLLLSARNKLLKLRAQRSKPHKDDKILTAWNGLMIGALARAYQVLDDKHYLEAAQNSARFIRAHLQSNDGFLLRRFRDGEARFPAYLDDYAFMIKGLLDLYESDFDNHWLTWAIDLQEKQDSLFYDPGKGGYFFSDAKDSTVILRQKQPEDGALPSSSAVSVLNLLRLYGLTFNKKYKDRVDEILRFLKPKLEQAPAFFSQTLIALDYRLDRSKEIAIVPGNNQQATQDFLSYRKQTFLPNQVLAMIITNTGDRSEFPPLLKNKKAIKNKTTYYVCENHLCKQPTIDLNIARGFIEDYERYSL
jgi:uncharacterized protein YyaL (SSP411 family)